MPIKQYLISLVIILILFILILILPSSNVDSGVILWFDDGLKNTFDVAHPMMKEYGYVGIVSVITDRVGDVFEDGEWRGKPCMDLTELRMLREDGWEIASHTRTHPYLNEISQDQAEDEIIGSKHWIEENLGVSPAAFIYPYDVIAHEDIVQENYRFERTYQRGLWDGHNNIPVVFIKEGETWKVDYWLKKIKEDGGFAVFVLHSIVDSPEGLWENTPEEFQGLLSNISTYNLPIVTLSEVSDKNSKNLNKSEILPMDIMDIIETIIEFLKNIFQKLIDFISQLQD